MVSVDYTTLFRIIQQFMHTGVFRAKVLASRYQAQGYIELHVKEGEILYCFFVGANGKLEKWDAWEQRLIPLGVLNWEHETQPIAELDFSVQSGHNPTTPITQPFSFAGPAQSFSPIPYQVITLSQAQHAQLPSLCRRAYLLIDGRRRSSDIALILQKPAGEITQAINYLTELGVVRIR